MFLVYKKDVLLTILVNYPQHSFSNFKQLRYQKATKEVAFEACIQRPGK